MLGPCEIADADGATVTAQGRKATALLAYLSLSPGQRCSREKLADLLWPDRPSVQARNSLRQTFSLVRRMGASSGRAVFQADRDFIALSPGALDCDVLRLFELYSGSVGANAAAIAELYRGPFLDGFFSGSTVFDEWAATIRQQVETAVIHALHEAARICHPDEGLALLHRLLAMDPTREATYQLGMELYAVLRQRDQALRLYESCKAMLAREYGVGPSPETERIRHRIAASLPVERGESTDPAVRRGEGMTVLVCPFENLSANPQYGAFLKALQEAVVIELARNGEIVVMLDPQGHDRPDVVVGGSLLADAGQMQLIMRVTDGASGRHLSGQRFRLSAGEQISALDDIAECIALSTRFECLHHRWQLRDLAPVDGFPVRLLVLRSHCRYYELTTPSLIDAVRLAERALELDPGSLRAQRMLALALTGGVVQGALPHGAGTVQRSIDLARGVARAIPEDVFTRCVLAWALGNDGQHPAAIEELRYAIQLNPRYSTLRSDIAGHYALMGYASEALAELDEASRLGHEDVVTFWRHQTASVAHFAAGNHAAALENARRALRDKPGLLRAEVFLAASAAALGMMEEAGRAVDRLLRDHPGLNLRTVAPGLVPRFVQDQHHRQFLLHLGRAGLPD